MVRPRRRDGRTTARRSPARAAAGAARRGPCSPTASLSKMARSTAAYSATEAPSIKRIMLLSHRKPLRNDWKPMAPGVGARDALAPSIRRARAPPFAWREEGRSAENQQGFSSPDEEKDRLSPRDPEASWAFTSRAWSSRGRRIAPGATTGEPSRDSSPIDEPTHTQGDHTKGEMASKNVLRRIFSNAGSRLLQCAAPRPGKHSQLLTARGMAAASAGGKIQAAPMVYVAGEEMTRYTMDLILKRWIKPHVDTSAWEFFDLRAKNRDDTEDQVLRDVISAGARLKAIFKEPTITPTADQVKRLGLKKWGSPNGIRAAAGRHHHQPRHHTHRGRRARLQEARLLRAPRRRRRVLRGVQDRRQR